MIAEPHRRRPLFARFYVRVGPAMERAGMAAHRRQLLAGLRGDVLEVGAGNGLNFPHYPPTVARVVAVEPEPYLRACARAGARRAPLSVAVVDGVAERLPVADASFDAVVVSLVLCSVADPEAAAGELARVLRPGGQVRFLEHVRAVTAGLAGVQRLLDATVWPRLTGGCHTGRDPVAAFERAGLRLTRLTRLSFPDWRVPFPASPHVLGVAVRTDAAGRATVA